MTTDALGRRGQRRPDGLAAEDAAGPSPLDPTRLEAFRTEPPRHAAEDRPRDRAHDRRHTENGAPPDHATGPHALPAPPDATPPPAPAGPPGAIAIDPGVDPAAVPTDGIGVALGDTFRLHSLPGSSYRVHLDFDGHVTTDTAWNGYWGATRIESPAFSLDGDGSFSAVELLAMQRIWQQVAEYFAPFNIDVTTEDPGADALALSSAADTAHGIRIVVTDEGGKPYGGIAWIGSFNFSIDTPAFVYANALGDSLHNIVVATAHEAGHALGLSHDGRGGSEYYGGHGSGGAAWAPVMGVGYNAAAVQWSGGQYNGATNTEDDLAIITSRNYGVAYRPDEAGGTRATAAALSGTIGADGIATVQRYGIISGSGAQNDIDRYAFTLVAGGSVDLRVSAWAATYVGVGAAPVYSALPAGMLDVKLTLYRGNSVVATVNDPARLDAAVSLSGLAGGSYSLAIDGTGWGAPTATDPSGWTEYGSLGQYMITGTYTATATADTTAPAAPVILQVADDTAPQAGPVAPGGVTNDTTPTLSGTAEALSIVTLRDGALLIGSASAGADGRWAITAMPLAQGAHAITATATDAAGNVSAATAPRSLSVDSIAPAAPAFLAPLAGGAGLPPTALTGTAEAGSLVSILDHDALLGTTLADASGAWLFATALLGTPGFRFTATAADAAGNVSTPSLPYAGPMALEVDRAAITLAETNGSALLTLRLANVVDPGLSVAVAVAGLDPTESQALADALVLNAGNGWSATLQLLGVDDRDLDGPQVQTLSFAAPGLNAIGVDVTTRDDEIAATTYTRNAGGAVGLAAFAVEDGVGVTTTEKLTAGGAYVIDQRWGFEGLAAGDYRVHLTGSTSEEMRLMRSLDGGLSFAAVRRADGTAVAATAWDDDYTVPGVTDRLMLRLVDWRGVADAVQDSVTIDLMTIALLPPPLIG